MQSLLDHLRKVTRLLRRRGTGLEDAEDLVQEAVLRLHAYTQKGLEVHDVERFVTRTAINLAVDSHRRAHEDLYVSAPVEDFTSLIDTRPAPDEMLAIEQQLEAMRAALDRVSHRTREIFFMHRLQGFSHAEIAARMGISKSAVEKHIASAVTILAIQRSRERGRA